MSDSESDDNRPIGGPAPAASDESSDSDSDESDQPISQIGQTLEKTQISNARPRTKNASYSSGGSESDDSEESDSDVAMDTKQSGAKAKSKSPASARNGNNGNNTNNKQKKSRKKRRFEESDSESDESSESEDSTEDAPVVAAARISKPPPAKRPRHNSSSSSSSANSGARRGGGSNNNNSSSSGNKSRSGGSKSKAKASKSRKSGSGGSSSSSSPRRGGASAGTRVSAKGVFATKESFPPSNYAVKSEIVPLETDKNAIKWWDRDIEELLADTKKWHTLDHNGVVFAPPYEPHGVKMKYNGKPMNLTPDQEELATMYGVMLETDYISKPAFQANFMREFKKVLIDKKQERMFPQIVDLSKCDFRDIYDWYQKKKEAEKELKKDKEYKEKLKREKEEMDSKFGYALVDGIKEKVGNYKVEPPGLFRGRGEHPKMGLLKKRLNPEDVTLNIGKGMAIPPCPVPGHNWGGVIHDQSVTYIAKWIEGINGQHKFVYLHSSSRFKGESDLKKYEKARTLKKHVDRIRRDYASKLNAKALMQRQLATAVWIIDHLSIRVGNEKDTDEEADTVGVCSLRIEHMKFDKPPNSDKAGNREFRESELTVEALDHNQKTGYFITLDFLGKDSMRYHQRLEIPRVIWWNLRIFCDKKKADQDIFHKIDPNKVNEYLKNQMQGLTAKVFRTHNASVCLQSELSKNFHKTVGKITKDSSLNDKIYFYNQCNRTVAILCNHQKTVSKGFADSLKKIDEKIEEMKQKISELKDELKVAEGKKDRSWLKHEVKKIRSPEQIKISIEKKKEQLRKKELAKAEKKDNKEVALGTSKINYMDPRITVSWCKKMEVPIEKVFNKSLLDKFPWAMNAKIEFEF